MKTPSHTFSSTRLPAVMEGTRKPEIEDFKTSLHRTFDEHEEDSLRIRDRAERAKKDAVRSAAVVSELLVDAVNGGVQSLFLNEKRIEFEIRALVSSILRYKKQTDSWLAASHAMNSVLKEIGDFENWMKIMDYDCKSINAAIRNIHRS